MSDGKMRKRIILLNLIMACIIAVYHFGNAELAPLSAADQRASELVSDGIEMLAGIAMSWFFMITGFLLFRGFTPEQYLPKLKRRFFTVFIAYLCWQLAFGCKGLISGELGLKRFIQTTFLLKVDPPDGPLWYMCAIFYLAILSPLFYPLVKNKKIGIITILLVLAGSRYITTTKYSPLAAIGQYGRVKNVFLYLSAYFSGLYFGLHHEENDLKTVLKLLACTLVIGFTLDLAWDGTLRFTVLRIMPVLLLYTFPVIENEHFCKYASGSFLIYAMHAATKWGRITRIRRIFLLPVSESAWFLNLFARLGALAFTIGVCCVLWALGSLFCPFLLKLFTGGRVPPLCKPVWELRKKKDDASAR